MNGKLLGLNKWAWAGVAALGVVVFLYFRHKQNTAAADTAYAPNPDASATDTAAFGGTPASVDNGSVQPPDNSALLGDLMSLLEQSQMEYGNLAEALVGSGVFNPATAATATGTATTTTGTTTSTPTATGAVIIDTGVAKPVPLAPVSSTPTKPKNGGGGGGGRPPLMI
jgi:hypothetical protein